MKRILMVLIIVLLAGCKAPSSKVIDSIAGDTVWGVEQLETGFYRVWFVEDNLAGYCTDDEELVALLKDNLTEKVIFTFESINYYDDENSFYQGCYGIQTTSESRTEMYRLLTVQSID